MDTVFLSVDSLRWDYLSEADTPAIDALSASGVDCSLAFSAAPYTTAACPALLSGTYPWDCGGYPGISAERPYLPELLSQAGYRTGVFHSNPYLDATYGYDRGVDEFVDSSAFSSTLSRIRQYLAEAVPEDTLTYAVLRRLSGVAERLTGSKLGIPYATADELNDATTRWLDSGDGDQFAWLHYMDVHNPYVPHEGVTGSDISVETAVDLHNRMIERPESLSSDDVQRLESLYVGEIEYLDARIGEILSTLDDDTVVVFTSDHGEGFYEHGFFSHLEDEFFDELAHVPLVVDGPTVSPRTVTEPASIVDIVPTVCELAGIDPPAACAGASLVTDPDRQFVFGHAGDRDDGTAMITDGRWKLVRRTATGGSTLLERTDGAERECDPDEHAERFELLEGELDAHLADVDEPNEGADDQFDVDDDARKRLERLGYVD